jgi:hypothetical protein
MLALAAAEPPALRPGEGLAFASLGGKTEGRGEAASQGPLGDLSGLLWLRLEGFDWSSRRVAYKCSGREGDLVCTLAKGHGRVDLGKAFERNCRLAFVSWIRQSAVLWSRLEGDAAARIKLEEVFGAFTGPRFPKGDQLPAWGLDWVGEGDLFRASPVSLATWLADTSQDAVSGLFKRYGSGFFEGDVGDDRGWAYVGHAGAGSAVWTWVAAGQSGHVAVMRIPGTLDRAAALLRFREAAGTAQPSSAKRP